MIWVFGNWVEDWWSFSRMSPYGPYRNCFLSLIRYRCLVEVVSSSVLRSLGTRRWPPLGSRPGSIDKLALLFAHLARLSRTLSQS